jgi:ribosomal protein S18 acetylase RimI-like enzyme
LANHRLTKSPGGDNRGVGDQHEIRRAGPGDAAEVARLLHDFNAEFEEPTPEVPELTGYVRTVLEGDDAVALLGAGGGGAGGGYEAIALIRFRVAVWTGEPEAHLQELYVAPARRGRGVGRAMLEATLAAARERGATYIDLGTGETDTAARALYESFGFSNREGGPDGPSMLFYERKIEGPPER